MAFCKFSSGFIANTSITIDASFLNDYLPYAPENCVKVYLFGLLKCQNSSSFDNTIENFENVLGLSKEDILNIFLYWQDQNLIQVLNTDPIEVRYLPVKNALKKVKVANIKKYSSFTLQAQEIIEGREITPNEFNEYIDFLETTKMQPDALLMIMKYCVNTKGDNIGYSYILTVAKNWARDGIRTTEKVEEHLETLNTLTNDNSKIAKALKFQGNLGLEHQQLFSKWKDELGFDLGTIVEVAKEVAKKTKKNGYEMLDATLLKYYEQKLMSVYEIKEFEKQKTALTQTAKNINKAIGVYYENVDNVVSTYVLPWINKGYTENTLLEIANLCFRSSVRTLDGMDEKINKFYKLGLISTESINQYIDNLSKTDKEIKNLLIKLGIDRKVNSLDRKNFKTWVSDWKMNNELIDYAAELSVGKANPFPYMNKILSNWHQNNVEDIKEAKKVKVNDSQKETVKTATVQKSYEHRSYSDDDVNSLFDNLDDIEI